MADKLSHLDDAGRPRMVDVTAKEETAREATASGSVYMSATTLALATSGRAAKGDVLTTARLAGIMAAKRTHELIPLCHPLPLTGIDVELAADEARNAIDITATVRTTAKTGVEMEALTAVAVAALTVYDMLKAAQKDMRISDVRLVRKTGGKSGDYEQP
jgi:cyclic pyranopterin phosphate synthase